MYFQYGKKIEQQNGSFNFSNYLNHSKFFTLDIVADMDANFLQPLIYGRGPTPAGMAMMPMLLPDGRIGYVL